MGKVTREHAQLYRDALTADGLRLRRALLAWRERGDLDDLAQAWASALVVVDVIEDALFHGTDHTPEFVARWPGPYLPTEAVRAETARLLDQLDHGLGSLYLRVCDLHDDASADLTAVDLILKARRAIRALVAAA
jgi:hypothetical protein